ncbi:MAG: hypothetical protein C0600_14310, partial [Ignavibacteria bacterium]
FEKKNQRIAFVTATGPPDILYWTPNNSFLAGTWQHFAVVVNGPLGRARVYINGELIISPKFSSRQFDCKSGLAWCGYHDNDVGAYFDGLIDEARYWNVERTQEQIRATKDIDLPPNDREGLVGWWRFCDSYEDYSDQGNHGTEVGSPRLELISLPFGITCWPDPCEAHDIVFTGNREVCIGDTVVLGTTFPYHRYYWSTGDTTSTTRVMAAGLYSLIAFDSLDCRETASVYVNIHPKPEVDVGPNITVCHGVDTTIGNMPHRPDWRYVWHPSTGLSNSRTPVTRVTADSTRTYTLTVTDDIGCTAEASVLITVYERVLLNLKDSVSVCRGDSVSLPLQVLQGEEPYSYLWSPSRGLDSTTIGQPVASPDSTTWYFVTVWDRNGCTAIDSILVIVRELPTTMLPDTVYTCRNQEVILPLDVYPLRTTMLFQWEPTEGLSNPAAQRPRALIEEPTTYSVLVTDLYGCTAEDSVTVLFHPPTIIGISVMGESTFCMNDSVLLTATPGYASYRWQTPSRAIPDTAGSLMAREAGPYIVSVIDSNGCDAVSPPVRISVYWAFELPVRVTGSNPLCPGDTVVLETDEGYEGYYWTDDSGAVVGTGTVLRVGHAGTYRVFAHDSRGCAGRSQPIIVRMAASPGTAILGPLEVCLGSDHEYRAAPSSARSFQWSVTGGESQFTPDSAILSMHWTEVGELSLRLRIIDSTSGCTDSTEIRVTVVPRPMPVLVGPVEVCAGDSASYFLEHREGVLDWQLPSGAEQLSATDDTIRIRWPVAGSYYLRVEERAPGALACSGTDSLLIQVHALPDIQLTMEPPSSICEGDSVVLTATEGYDRYAWMTPDGILDTTSNTLWTGNPGVYTVSVSSPVGCTATSDPVEVTVLPAPEVHVTGPRHFCVGATAVYKASLANFTSCSWSVRGGMILGDTDRDSLVVFWDGLGTGFIAVEANNGACSALDSLTVEVADSLHPEIIVHGPLSLCPGDSVRLDAGEGYLSYEWHTPLGVLYGQSITVTLAGTYRVHVTSFGDCAGSSDPFELRVWNPVPPVVLGPTAMCPGDTVVLEASAGYTDHQWTNGTIGRFLEVSQPGSYAVQAVDSNGCTAVSSPHSVVYYPPAPVPEITREGNQLVASVSRSWQWYRNDTLLQGEVGRTHTVTAPGRYTVETLDENGCRSRSDIIDIERLRGLATVRLPHLRVSPGDSVRIFISLEGTAGLESAGAEQFTAMLRYHSSMLVPLDGTNPGQCEGADRLIPFSGSLSQLLNGALPLHFLATLGDRDSIPLLLDEF